MKSFIPLLLAALLHGIACVRLAPSPAAIGPFLTQINNETWIIGNEIWNVTQGRQYGVKLLYNDRDCVGQAVGHYVSYNGAASNLNWTSASVFKQGSYEGSQYIDVKFTALEGDMHWVIMSGLAGAYQYFVNHALPQLGEFRTLWRLDNETFTHGKTDIKDQELPPLSEYIDANKVQDETWLAPDGRGYITKYDFASWVRTQTYYGVYGDSFGSWYMNPGKDYYNGNHLKQELMVHRESATGDVVQLNMIHGTHFQVSAVDDFPDGKMWGPWLWYLNNGSKEDAARRAEQEFAAWPYAWLEDEAYQSRGSVQGQLVLSDGRPATNAAVFLGDNEPNKTALDMGSDYYYTTYADADGYFEFRDVRSATYGLQAWSNGSKIADVTKSYLRNNVVVSKEAPTDLGPLEWATSSRPKIFQVGDFDRTSYGFLYGGSPHQHALVASCPADLLYTVGTSQTADWCFGQTYAGNWTIKFELESAAPTHGSYRSNSTGDATLIVSLAGYSQGASSLIWANGMQIGNLTSASEEGLLNDPSLYRSATAAGEWRYFEFPFDSAAVLRQGANEVTFQLVQNTTWRGFMWDSIVLEW
ncbi:Uu.00g112860.m01.CDS01 [Anthostomella pinea]|uniref:rhamnogalacturonan endolyase n=1 Tax=Anthostomella pinea TaxID=933095 RepID=A0AAI8VA74_9PEZI|nr:Uu.00g112860.m01.CDS01 [Anthostomella pinea]